MTPVEFTILKVSKKPSKINREFYWIFFKGDDGKSYRTCVDPANRNYSNWKEIMQPGYVLKGIRIKFGNLIDADSRPVVVRKETWSPEPAND